MDDLTMETDQGVLDVSGKFDHDLEIRVSIYHAEGDREVWITHEHAKELINHLKRAIQTIEN